MEDIEQVKLLALRTAGFLQTELWRVLFVDRGTTNDHHQGVFGDPLVPPRMDCWIVGLNPLPPNFLESDDEIYYVWIDRQTGEVVQQKMGAQQTRKPD